MGKFSYTRRALLGGAVAVLIASTSAPPAFARGGWGGGMHVMMRPMFMPHYRGYGGFHGFGGRGGGSGGNNWMQMLQGLLNQNGAASQYPQQQYPAQQYYVPYNSAQTN